MTYRPGRQTEPAVIDYGRHDIAAIGRFEPAALLIGINAFGQAIDDIDGRPAKHAQLGKGGWIDA